MTSNLIGLLAYLTVAICLGLEASALLPLQELSLPGH